MKKPYLIEFKKLGNSGIGYISVSESQEQIPFQVERIFWTYFTPEDVVRGKHAHYKTEQILIAVAGKIIVNVDMPSGEKDVFVLEKPNIGLYMPPDCWHTMQYSHSSIQLVLASTKYNEEDYIRSFEEFKKVYSNEHTNN